MFLLSLRENGFLRGMRGVGVKMEIIIFTGMQASGKTSFYKQNFFNTHVRVNLDMLKTRHREKVLVEALIESKTPFVVDNTNPSKADRNRYLSYVRGANVKIVSFFFDSSLDDCLRRNALRTGKERIPDVGLRSCAKKIEIPEFDEPFDEIYAVRLNDAKGFTVEPL